MKKLSLFLMPLIIVACGKGELLENARVATNKALLDSGRTLSKGIKDTGNVLLKGVDDGFNTINKGAEDSFSTADKGINDASKEVARGITRGNDIKNEIARNSGDFTEKIGDTVESLGQMPKNAVNQLLGNDSDSEKNDRLLRSDLNDLQNQVNELKEEVAQNLSFATKELGELKGDISRVSSESIEADQALSKELDLIHTSILDELNSIRQTDGRALLKIRQLRARLSNLRGVVRDLKRTVGSLETSCYTYRSYGYYYYYEYYRTYCEIYSRGRYDNDDEDDHDDD